MRGRKPKPVEQRRLEGGSDVSHRAVAQPMLIAGRPAHELDDPPDDLPLDGKAFWVTTVRRLVEVGMLDLVDETALRMLATQYARWREAGRIVDEHGHLTHGAAGQWREHPALKIEREAHGLFLKTAEQFGLTPMARTRLGLAELHRRSLHGEMERTLGGTGALDGEVVAVEVALPGASTPA
jgi:P27 family predicted phage terminase small subunit